MFDTDWRSLVLHSYTAWAFYALALITVAPDLIYWLSERDTNPAVWSSLQLWVIVLGIFGRLVLQPKSGVIKRRIILGVIVLGTVGLAGQAMAQQRYSDRAFMDNALPLIAKWEGKRNHSYKDIVGVWTICYGHTRTAGPGQYKTDAECRDLLKDEITEYRHKLHRYFTEPTKANRLTPKRDAAYTSLAFNVGWHGAGKSTATRRLNRGDIRGGCHAIGWWNRAGGRVVRGLVNRRAEEVRMCLEGA